MRRVPSALNPTSVFIFELTDNLLLATKKMNESYFCIHSIPLPIYEGSTAVETL